MKKNALWMIVGNGGYALSQAVSMIILNKYLGIDALGIFSLALALTAPIMLFTNFGMRNLWITDVENKYRFVQFIKLRHYLSATGVLICLVFSILYNVNYSVYPVVFIIALSKYIENSADIYYAKWHKDSEQKSIAISLLVRGCAGCVGILLGAMYFNDLIYAVFFYSLFWFLSHYSFDVYSHRKSNFRENVESVQLAFVDIVKLGFPLAVGLLLINFNFNIPRLVLEKVIGIKELGIYAALYFFVQTGSVFVNSLGQVALPKLAVLYSERKMSEHLAIFLKLFLCVILFGFISAFIFWVVGASLLSALFGSEVSAFNNVLVLMFLLSPAQYAVSLLGHVISSTKKNYSIVNSQIIVVVVNVISSYYCIQYYGVLGAVWGGFFASFVALLMYVYSYSKLLRVNKDG